MTIAFSESTQCLGEKSSDFYIFVSGCLQILDEHNKVVGEVPEEDVFGEIEFFQDIPRTESVFSSEDRCSFLWKLSREDYQNITDHPEFYTSKISLFLKIPKEERIVLAKYATVQKYPAQTLLAKRGDLGDKLSIVIDGSVYTGSGSAIKKGNHFGTEQVFFLYSEQQQNYKVILSHYALPLLTVVFVQPHVITLVYDLVEESSEFPHQCLSGHSNVLRTSRSCVAGYTLMTFTPDPTAPYSSSVARAACAQSSGWWQRGYSANWIK